MRKTQYQQKIITFFFRHPEAFVRMVSEFYAFQPHEIQKHFQQLNIGWLSKNECCQWDSATINLLKDQINWEYFSIYSQAFADTNLIDEFITYIVWKDFDPSFLSSNCLSSNSHVPWSAEFIGKYENYIDFEGLSANPDVPWSEELLTKFDGRWNWPGLSMNKGLPWSEEFIARYEDLIDWESLITFNYNIPWSASLVEKYFHKFDHREDGNFSINGLLYSNVEIIEKFGDFLCWGSIGSNPYLPWFEENLLERWKDRLHWVSLIQNQTLMKDPQFYENILDKCIAKPKKAFYVLSLVPTLPWSISYIDRFIDYWEWSFLSSNWGLPWSMELIDYYLDKWDWGDYIRTKEGSVSGMTGLINNSTIPWDIDWILKYEKFIDIESLSLQPMIWDKVFKPHMDEKMVDTIFQMI